MVEFLRVEQQSSSGVLKDRKTILLGARKEIEAAQASLTKALEILKQNAFYEREIGGARGRVFLLMVAQVRRAEAMHCERYIAQITEEIDRLTKAGEVGQE